MIGSRRSRIASQSTILVIVTASAALSFVGVLLWNYGRPTADSLSVILSATGLVVAGLAAFESASFRRQAIRRSPKLAMTFLGEWLAFERLMRIRLSQTSQVGLDYGNVPYNLPLRSLLLDFGETFGLGTVWIRGAHAALQLRNVIVHGISNGEYPDEAIEAGLRLLRQLHRQAEGATPGENVPPGLIEIRQSAGRDLLLRGLSQLDEGDSEGALEAFEDLAATDDRDLYIHALMCRGLVLEDLGRYEEALTVLREASRVSEDGDQFAQALLAEARVLGRLGRVDEALDVLMEARSKGDSHSAGQAASMIGVLMEQRGQTEEALDWFRMVVHKGDPALVPGALINIGVLLQAQGEIDEAVETFKRVLEYDDPEARARASLNIGIALEQSGRLKEAREAYTRAVDTTNVNVSTVARDLIA